MFEMQLMYADHYENGDVVSYYRDKNMAVTHVAVKRGGCLWMGEIEVHNLWTGQRFAFCSTMSPTDDDHPTARAYLSGIAAKHAHRVGYSPDQDPIADRAPAAPAPTVEAPQQLTFDGMRPDAQQGALFTV
jgi:hypothetical protein